MVFAISPDISACQKDVKFLFNEFCYTFITSGIYVNRYDRKFDNNKINSCITNFLKFI